ncbi:MAG: hypothetical protein LBQ66_10680 [Planctomycetaceae bacterium]|jgi:hypothetical protein|nr:hypothetical protein [Planctomycetaceae bacterium]
MKKTNCLVSVLFFLCSICVAGHFVLQDAVFAAKLFRRHSSVQQQSDQVDVAKIVAGMKANPVSPTTASLTRSKSRLLAECDSLIDVLDKDPIQQSAEFWRTTLKIDELKSTLSKSELPDINAIQDIWNAFNQDKTGIRWEVFNGVRNELRRYVTIHSLVNSDKKYNDELAKVCDHLINVMNEHIKTSTPESGVVLNELLVWFNDIGLFDSRGTTIVNEIRKKISIPNFKFAISDKFMAIGFKRDIARELDVDETIQGTKIIGSGTMVGTSSSFIVPQSKGAAIDIVVDAEMETETTGYHSPVTLETRTTGTLTGRKRILLASNKISAQPATSNADLKADIHNVRVNAGRIVTCIAKQQVESQREDSLDEAKLRAAARLNEQIDSTVDQEIFDANFQYQEGFRKPLRKIGLLPYDFELSSSAVKVKDSDHKTAQGHINGKALVGTVFQSGSTKPAPAIENKYDIFVQLHQSFPNNIAAFAFAGKNFDESKSDLTDQLGNLDSLKQILERKEGQDPIAVTFANKVPIAITFDEDLIRVVVRVNSFLQKETRYPGLDITLVYKVKTETQNNENKKETELSNDNSPNVVLELVGKPDAMPRGKDNTSAREQAIRTIVLRRLESVPNRVELKPFGLQWKGWKKGGELKPTFAKSKDGWLTIGLDWIENDESPITINPIIIEPLK